MGIAPIKTERDYRRTLKEIEGLMMAKHNTPEGDRLDVLVTLIEAWEVLNHPLDLHGPMLNPPHLGELIRESMDEAGLNVTEAAAKLGCGRGTLSRLLNGKGGVTAYMALALEDIGWGTADHWMRMQASYELSQARREKTPAKRQMGATHA